MPPRDHNEGSTPATAAPTGKSSPPVEIMAVGGDDAGAVSDASPQNTPSRDSSDAPGTGTDQPTQRQPVTLRGLVRQAEQGTPFACLTCYDATTARWLERAGVPVLLVGDTAAEMILGFDGTIHAPLDFLLQITAAVKRGAPNTLVLGDMPFMSYQAGEDQALINAGRFLTEGRADLVKLEVDRHFAPLIERMERAGIPTIAHIGSRPQRMKLQGGYRAAGRTAAAARELVADAVALEEAGATMLLIEACPTEVSAMIVEKTHLPVIGCGAGDACHGQIVVLHDLLGLTDWQPSFAKPLAQMGRELEQMGRNWVQQVAHRDLGPHPYTMPPGELGKL